jgi:hypothetical protein
MVTRKTRTKLIDRNSSKNKRKRSSKRANHLPRNPKPISRLADSQQGGFIALQLASMREQNRNCQRIGIYELEAGTGAQQAMAGQLSSLPNLTTPLTVFQVCISKIRRFWGYVVTETKHLCRAGGNMLNLFYEASFC